MNGLFGKGYHILLNSIFGFIFNVLEASIFERGKIHIIKHKEKIHCGKRFCKLTVAFTVNN